MSEFTKNLWKIKKGHEVSSEDGDETQKCVIRSFGYHPPNEDQINEIRIFRKNYSELATAILSRIGIGPERDQAFAELEQSFMHVEAAIARGPADE